ncbi:O-antigen ligase family protein [Streptomyces sp. NPDC060194]|uniref:O-antigen ligase family protein n=1 Tax=Streptomyces sp. NPDC060194 TaxID=3347069 RepID=UPI00366543F6
MSDGVGAALIVGCAVWALVAAAGRDARPEGVLLAVLAVCAGYACGRLWGSVRPAGAFALTAAAALVAAVASHDGLRGAGASAPSGHTGATAALVVLAAGAACCGAAAARSRGVRTVSRLLAAAAVGGAPLLGSPAGFAGAVGVVLCALAAARTRRRAAGLAALLLATGLVAGVSWAVAEEALPRGLASSLEGPLTARRVSLWQDALDLARENPERGVGPGRFAVLSPTAGQALHGDGRPHSAPLQVAAEQGAVGVALFAALFGWMLFGLWRSPVATPVALTAGAALAALAVLAAIGNVLSFAPVTAGAGLLAGLAAARPAARLRDD